MDNITAQFNATFAHWKIQLPPEAPVTHKGKISKAGWAIWYLLGSGNRGEYLDYYACHRMTNDRHVRIYASGEEKDLPAMPDFRVASTDPEEDKKLEREYRAECRRVKKSLQAKGLGPYGLDSEVAVKRVRPEKNVRKAAERDTSPKPDTPKPAFTLSRPGKRDVRNPSVQLVERAVAQLNALGCGFFALNRSPLGYMQCGGGAERFTVECRDWLDDEFQVFRHFVAGRSEAAGRRVRIATEVFHSVSVFQNERLTSDEAKVILLHYLQTGTRHQGYRWRDMTLTFED